MKTYRISEASLSAPGGVVVIMDFPAMGRHEVLLSEAAAYIRTTQGIAGRMPVRVSLTDGRKVGAFPTIRVLTHNAAEKLSAAVGYEVEVDDGIRCATQLQAREILQRLHRNGVSMEEIHAQWMITPPEPTATNPRPNSFTQEQRELALSDSPF
jgi:hypothetical protein